jgi:hypothetical protein
MAQTTKRIKVNALDFDEIKDNLKTFLSAQDKFQDYDFEGSAFNILLDVLAYNTHYNNLYTNLAVNEMFLDSASKRSSVVSLAKMLGYTPNSAKCAKAYVNATITAPTYNPDVITLPANQPFLTSIDGISYTFYNVSDVTTVAVGGTYSFNNVELIEGIPLTYSYSIRNGQKYIIPNQNVDLTTLVVKIRETPDDDTYVVYTPAESITQLDSNTKSYFVKELDDGIYEVYFGDGVVGYKPVDGNYLTFEYYVSSLEGPNGANTFSYAGTALLGSGLTVVASTEALGGASPEDVESVKYNAPRLFAAQNRAVTTEDYKSLIYKNFPQADSVVVWGGEDNDPPVYGKTFICVKPTDTTKLTDSQKDFIRNNIIAPKSIVSITPEFIDPEYFNVQIDVTAYYNAKISDKTPAQLETLIRNAIYAYDDTNLKKFDGVLRYSQLVRLVDEVDQAIVNNTTKILVRREFTPRYNLSSEYKLNMINPIFNSTIPAESVISTGFYIPNTANVHYIDDDGQGNLRLFYFDAQQNKYIVDPSIGEVNYAKGTLIVRNLTITSMADAAFEFVLKPESYDVVTAYNQIVQVARNYLNVKVVNDMTAAGSNQAGKNYIFTSIRNLK